jgi:hypothetical protein
MAIDAFTLSGLAGVAVILGAYFANQQRWLRSEDWRFPLANMIGSCLILVSFYTAWNLPAAIIEVCWAAISLWGLVKGWFTRASR